MSVERVLFLDIDGVLNHADTRPRTDVAGLASWLDATHLPPLNRVLAATNARIVVSSSWRVGRSLEELRTLLGGFGVIAPIIDATPVSPRRRRDEEIAAWLARHPVAAYAIVDDDLHIDEGPLAAQLVCTSMLHGLTDEHVAPLVARLSLPYVLPWMACEPQLLELERPHPLHGRRLRAVARHAERDDWLCELDDAGPSGPLAVVPRGLGAAAPRIYAARWRFEEERMLPDASSRAR